VPQMEGLARQTIYCVNPDFSAFPSFKYLYSVIAAQLDQRTPKLQTTAMASRTSGWNGSGPESADVATYVKSNPRGYFLVDQAM